MALTVRDILELPSGQKMTILAGEKGLDRPVVTCEIADYEFDPDVGYDAAVGMETNGFIITSFLFAKHDPSLILTSVKQMYEIGMSCVAYKKIIYDELPSEVLAFANDNDFPVLSMENDLWFENIVFDIMYAVQFDDKVYLSEEKIDNMLSGKMTRSELDIILKGISLKMRKYVSVVFISGDSIDAGRILRSYYLFKGLQSKGLMVRYGQGVFLITTSTKSDHKTHDLIREEAFEVLGIDTEKSATSETFVTGMSDVHEAAHLDRAFRESWYCYIASCIEQKPLHRFGKTGIYRVLLPAIGNDESGAFAKDILDAFAVNEDLVETAGTFVKNCGDIVQTSAMLHCHPNTIRYRLKRIRELTDLADTTDSELYLQLKTALAIAGAKAITSTFI